MSKWWWRADYVETCNCAHGCPCNFTMIRPMAAGVDSYHIREGDCDGAARRSQRRAGLRLARTGHHGHGRGVVYIDDRAMWPSAKR
jgi:hypothetical protein